MSESVKFKIGDYVRTPYGDVLPIEDTRDGFTNRADEWIADPVYLVDNPKRPGSPQVWFQAAHLQLATPLTSSEQSILDQLDRWRYAEQDKLRVKHRQEREALEADYQQRLKVFTERTTNANAAPSEPQP